MSAMLTLFDMNEQNEMAVLVKPAQHDDPLPPLWPANGIPPHPYSTINRMMTVDEARELSADIAAHGLLERIVIFENKILDGRNRYLACVALGLFPANVDWRTHPAFVELGGKGWDSDRGTDALAFVWGMEVRRHRSAKDTALAAARYLRFIADLKPEAPDGKTAKLRLPTQADIAKRHGISERLVHSAMVLLERAEPEVLAEVEGGKLSLTDGADFVAKLEAEEQRIMARVIADTPDKKTAKAAVKAAKPKASKPAPAPELPSPMSREALAKFAEEVLNEAHRVAAKHNGASGASMSADLVLSAARTRGIIEMGEFGFSRSMLLALGRLREAAPGPLPKKQPAEPEAGPSILALGNEWALKLGGLKPKHSGSIAVFHEEDDTYSISVNYDFAARSSSGPFDGSYPSFRDAIGAAAAELRGVLDEIVDAGDSVTSDVMRASAAAGRDWLDAKLGLWGIPYPALSETDAPTELDSAAAFGRAYADALEVGKAQFGQHTQATAEPIVRAGVAADIKRQQIADDLGHPLGTVKAWCGRLGLQDHSRLADNAKRLNERKLGAAS